MDTIAHGLWSLIFFFNSPRKWWAILIGILPDIIPFFPHLIVEHLVSHSKGQLLFDILYKFTHSLVIFLIVIGLIYLFIKKLYIISLAWPIHIIFDMFTHSFEYYPTPYLFPFNSPFLFAIDYRTLTFTLVNYSFILVILGVLYVYWGKKLTDC